MRAIFISYRREDAEGQAGRLFDDLVTQFGEESVFMDVAGIEAGRDFRQAIDAHVASCGVLLAMIGKSWIDAKDESERRRLDDPMDFVRLETASALKRDIPVIPVLVQGARMPRAEQLPSDLTNLAYRNAVELTHARWDSDVQVLIKALRPHVEPRQSDAGRVPSESPTIEPYRVGTPGTPGVPAGPGVAPLPVVQTAKRSLLVIAASLITAMAITGGSYAWYQKSQTVQLIREAAIPDGARRATADELAAKKQAEEKAAADELTAKKQVEQKAADDELAARRRAEQKAAADELAAKKQVEQKAAADELAARQRAEQKAAADELAAKKQVEQKAAADELAARQRAGDRAAAGELAARRQADERAAAADDLAARRRRQENVAAAHRARWTSYNFPPPNGGLLVFSMTPDGNPACASYNGAGCLWGLSYEQIDFQRIKPLVCGDAHRAQWRTTGYEDPRHWCNLARRVARTRS